MLVLNVGRSDSIQGWTEGAAQGLFKKSEFDDHAVNKMRNEKRYTGSGLSWKLFTSNGMNNR